MTKQVNISTIGFAQSTAENFFERLLKAGVKKIVDVRLHNTSQLAGFAKAEDLAYFLRKIGGIEYSHLVFLAPTDDIFKKYKKQKGAWSEYERSFLALMEERGVENQLNPEWLDGACLLCSEAKPHHCHRRLVCEYLNSKWDNRLIIHHL